jgi:hypothetical protein
LNWLVKQNGLLASFALNPTYVTSLCYTYLSTSHQLTLIQDIRADEAQRDWSGALASDVQRLSGSVAEAEQQLAALTEELDDLDDLEDITVEERLQQAQLLVERERKRRVPLALSSACTCL